MISLLDRLNEWNYTLGQMLQGQDGQSALVAVVVAFAAGVVTSFTPCAYPMIPITVTYMASAGVGRRRRVVALSAIYVAGLSFVYAALGVIAALLGKTFGAFTRNPWIYGGFGVLVILLGLAMLDLFSIPVPRFVTRMQGAGAQRGGYVGALLLGVAAGFIAAPCTAPVTGALLTLVAIRQEVVWGGFLLLVYGLGLSLLFFVLGVSAGLLSGLPKPGPWMKLVKTVLAVAILLVGLWFLYAAVTMLPAAGAGA